jgi:putative membrane protein
VTNLYVWLKFFHLFALAVFLFVHGVSGGASLALRAPVSTESRRLLKLSQRSGIIANPSLLVVIVTGVWMAFAGHWWGQGWLWASLVVLVALLGAMGFIARPYYMARDAAEQPDDVLWDRLRHTRPLAAIWIGGLGLAVLVFLMVFKPF